MPYTPAHAIVAAPLWYLSRKQLPLPPLVVGCIAPDLPYLVHLAPVHAAGHTVIGLVTHAVPHGLIALGAWYLWLEKPLLTLFALQPSKRQRSAAWFFLMLISLLLGAMTHALLDATSHESGWFVQQFDSLSRNVGGLPMFKWIQYGGGVIGLVALIWWYRGARAGTSGVAPDRHSILKGVAIFSASTLGFACLANWVHQSRDLNSFVVHSASGAMSGFVFGACLYATVVRITSVRRGAT